MRPLPNRKAACDCRRSTTGHGAARFEAANHHATQAAKPSLHADFDRSTLPEHPPTGEEQAAGPPALASTTLAGGLKSP
jgi:hypothetical protein